MSQSTFHGYEDSVRWRLTTDGLEVEGSGIERTAGRPATATRVWEAWAAEINQAARDTKVPCALIVATICTESAGKADAVRLEPGYVSDEQTPSRVSVGLMQTLISTAREAMQMSFGREWLLQARNAIASGTNYIAQQARLTHLDPPLVAAAYNAGGLYLQNGAGNRWKLRQYPIGTGMHCDRFVRFFNDTVFVLSRHDTAPAVGLDALLGDAPVTAAPRQAAGDPASVTISFGEGAHPDALTGYSTTVLKEIVASAGLRSVVVSSTARDPDEQARVMFDNLERYGADHQRGLYASAGRRVIDTYEQSRREGKSRDRTIADMAQRIRDIGPTLVSRHASDPRVLNVFDVDPASVRNKVAFERAVLADARVDAGSFFKPPRDPGYHLEIRQPRSEA